MFSVSYIDMRLPEIHSRSIVAYLSALTISILWFLLMETITRGNLKIIKRVCGRFPILCLGHSNRLFEHDVINKQTRGHHSDRNPRRLRPLIVPQVSCHVATCLLRATDGSFSRFVRALAASSGSDCDEFHLKIFFFSKCWSRSVPLFY